MRTTLELPDPLLRKAKKLARERKVPFRTIVAEALTRFLREPEAPTPFRLPDRSFRGDGLVADLADADWERIRDLAYEGRGG
ncbi:MAG: hypothetical protein SFW67_08700 [Myxococcaceae bacterium]|nr:hypothetical protein [Myxococcaceae bacterium]